MSRTGNIRNLIIISATIFCFIYIEYNFSEIYESLNSPQSFQSVKNLFDYHVSLSQNSEERNVCFYSNPRDCFLDIAFHSLRILMFWTLVAYAFLWTYQIHSYKITLLFKPEFKSGYFCVQRCEKQENIHWDSLIKTLRLY